MEMSDPKESWHLDKKLSIGHILTTVIIVAGALGAYMTTSERLAVLESKQDNINTRIVGILENQSLIDVRQDNQIEQVRQETREDYQIINGN
jgi:hypothetical protein